MVTRCGARRWLALSVSGSAALFGGLAAALVGCQAGVKNIGFGGDSSTGDTTTTATGLTTGTDSTGATMTTGTGFGTGSTGTGQTDNCSDASKLVYVFSSDNDIYSFDPPSKKFTKLGTPDCNTSQQPNSMAVDRNLNAWINYIGSIYVVDLKTMSGCKKAMDLPNAFQQIGMGFATNAVGTTDETLFIDGIGGGGLAKIDTATLQLTTIGNFSNDSNVSGESAELTGTGDARLYGYFTTSPNVRVAEINKGNANVISDHALSGVSPPSAWAFSFWGGSLYLYAAPGNNASGNSSVIKYDPATQAVDKNYVGDVGFEIVGAGVSTCAPTIPPS